MSEERLYIFTSQAKPLLCHRPDRLFFTLVVYC